MLKYSTGTSLARFHVYHSTKKITKLITKQFRFGNFFTKITEPKFPKQFGKGFGNPLLALLTETK